MLYKYDIKAFIYFNKTFRSSMPTMQSKPFQGAGIFPDKHKVLIARCKLISLHFRSESSVKSLTIVRILMKVRVRPSTCSKFGVQCNTRIRKRRYCLSLGYGCHLPLFHVVFSCFSKILSVMRCPDTDKCYNVTKNAFQKLFGIHDPLRLRPISVSS